MAILGKSEIKISCSNIKKSQVGKRDLSPLLGLRFTYTGVKERSGDKSLFPTCDFLMLGEKTDFLPAKSETQNGQTPGWSLAILGCAFGGKELVEL